MSVKVTLYQHTGYTFNDEPSSDAVIELNNKLVLHDDYNYNTPDNLNIIKVNIDENTAKSTDYVKIYNNDNGNRYYYFKIGHQKINNMVYNLGLRLDYVATVGLSNINFYGNIIRRSLSKEESNNYPLLAEPWTPRRPLKVRTIVVDVNSEKQLRIPSHISNNFETDGTTINKTEGINYPSSPLDFGRSASDSLTISGANLSMGYPNIANDTTHNINTYWGSLSYVTPYETYYNLSGTSLTQFLANAKKFNSLDLIGTPYYLPTNQDRVLEMTEFNKPNIKNAKAYKYYTTITIRSLAGNTSETFGDNDIVMTDNQKLVSVVVPDKNGGIYLMPDSFRNVGYAAYNYLKGVYSPFETVPINAVGDTPAKFAADGTNAYNRALTNMFLQYSQKINTAQYSKMLAEYLKDLGSMKSIAMAFFAEVLGGVSTAVSKTPAYQQTTDSTTTVPRIVTNTNNTSNSLGYNTTTSGTSESSNGRTSTESITPSYDVTETISQTSNNTIANPEYAPFTLSNQINNTMWETGYRYNWQQNPFVEVSNSITQDRTINYPSVTTTTSQSGQGGGVTINDSNTYIPPVTTNTTGSTTTNSYEQITTNVTNYKEQTVTTNTTSEGARREISEGAQIAEAGTKPVYEVDSWSVLRNYLGNGYVEELHSFMLGNLNDYMNRWASIENDLHNAKVANLFKNVTLIGTYSDYNKMAGKYEILVTSLQDEDVTNFDLYLQHFGHSVDEYTNVLVKDVGNNYNYTMVGDDALITNTYMAEANANILNQLRTGVRFWKTIIRPNNY